MGFVRNEDQRAHDAYMQRSSVNHRYISRETFFYELRERANSLANELVCRWRYEYAWGSDNFNRTVIVPFLPATVVVNADGSVDHLVWEEPYKSEGRALVSEGIKKVVPRAERFKVFLEPNIIRPSRETYDGDKTEEKPRGNITARLYVY